MPDLRGFAANPFYSYMYAMEWTADSLSGLATGYWASGTLTAAMELGVFAVLSQGPATVEAISRQTGGRAELLPALMDALVSLGLLVQDGPAYAIAPSAEPLLSAKSPTNMLGALAYNADLFRQWASLGDVIKTGQPVRPPPDASATMTRRFVLGMESKARAFAPALLPLIELNGSRQLLDVGAGPGTVSRMLAERDKKLGVTLLDLPDVLAVAKDVCAASPAVDRLTLHPADYRRDTLPSPFDAVLYAGALHQETVLDATTLINNCFAALKPGGKIFVVDLMLDPTRTRPTFSALFQLNMLLSRPTARVFSENEVADLLTAAGFDQPTIRRADGSPYVVVSARKPS